MSATGKYYFPQLDAIRGLSFLGVYFVHAFHPVFGSGFFNGFIQYLYNSLALSIDVFFILSAFLLTWLGIHEYRITGSFSFINYFIRRALRIWPLYILLMLFSFAVVPYAAGYFHVPVTLPPAYYYLFFISNFYLEGHVYFLRFLWTLSVEEQFYLLWGICLLFFQRQLLLCVWILAALSIAYTIYAVKSGADNYYNTLVYLFDFAIGISAAVLIQYNSKILGLFKNLTRLQSVLFLVMLPLLFLVMFCLQYFAPALLGSWYDVLMRYFFVVYTGLFILDQMINEKPLLQLKTSRFLIYTGKISYGLYCFHGIVLTFGLMAIQKTAIQVPSIITVLILLGINFAVSACSYEYIEKPFLKLKNKLRKV